MKSVELRFYAMQDNPQRVGQSSLVLFVAAIEGQNLEHRTVLFWYRKLVKKDDVKGAPEKQLLRWLQSRTVGRKTASKGFCTVRNESILIES